MTTPFHGMTAASLSTELDAVDGLDPSYERAVQARVDDILRPTGALARLDAVAVHLARWQQSSTPDVTAPSILVFAADHGVCVEGVSAYPSEVTGAMLGAFNQGIGSVNAIAESVGATVRAIDVGVGDPTGNIRVEPALTSMRFAAAFAAGRQAVDALPATTDLLVVGEMGIGNTTAAAVVGAVLLGGDVHGYVGAGTGVADEALSAKAQVVADAVDRIRSLGVEDPLEVLSEGGGAELVAMAGAMFQARICSLPVVLDGYISSVSALALNRVAADCTAHMLAGHRSAEPGHSMVLAALGLSPLLELDMRLGEASGGALAIPLVRAACRAVTHVGTFTELSGAEAE